jgi:hypothetical protein
MNRRAFLSLSAISPLATWLPAFSQRPGAAARELAADVVILGAGMGGIAAALAAAKLGLKVLLTEENDWIGGQLTSQAVPPDEHPWIEDRGCTKTYRAFRDGVRNYYRRNYPLTDAAKQARFLNPGNGTVSKLCHEPRVAVAVLLELLAPHMSAGRVRLVQPAIAVNADVDKDRVRAVTVLNRRTGEPTVLRAPYFVDATELGDLLPLAKAEFVTGAESRKDTGEPTAKVNAEPNNHQAFTCCFAMDYLDGQDHTIPKPRMYDTWSRYVPKMTPAWPGRLLSWQMSLYSDPTKVRPVSFNPMGPTERGLLNLWTYRRIADRNLQTPGAIPGDMSLVNWPQNDYWLGNLFGGPANAAAKSLDEAKQLSLSLLYWMQTEAPRPDGKQGWKGLRLRPDVVGTEDGLAQYPYVREARRIKAVYVVTENQVGLAAREKLTGKKLGEVTAEPFKDSVGIGSYRIDLHPSSGGDNYIDFPSLPFQIPLGALLPVRLENVIPACKNIGTTHLTNGCYRLHPVEWNIGEAVGLLVGFCLGKRETPRAVHATAKLLGEFQAALVRTGVELEWPAEIAKTPR